MTFVLSTAGNGTNLRVPRAERSHLLHLRLPFQGWRLLQHDDVVRAWKATGLIWLNLLLARYHTSNPWNSRNCFVFLGMFKMCWSISITGEYFPTSGCLFQWPADRFAGGAGGSDSATPKGCGFMATTRCPLGPHRRSFGTLQASQSAAGAVWSLAGMVIGEWLQQLDWITTMPEVN